MSLFGGTPGLSREQKQAYARNASLADKAGLYGDQYSADARARAQAYDKILLEGLLGGYQTGTRNISGGTGSAITPNWQAPSFTFTGGGTSGGPNPNQDYYTNDPGLELAKLRKMLSPNDFHDVLPRLVSGTDEQKKGNLDAYLRHSGYAPGISGFSEETINEFLKNPGTDSTVPQDISTKNFRKAGIANQVAATDTKVLDKDKYFDYVMGTKGAQNLTRANYEITQLRNKEGPMYDDFMRTAEKGRKERQAVTQRETAKLFEQAKGRGAGTLNRPGLAANEARANQELSAQYARDWDEFLMGFTERSNTMYQQMVNFTTDWANNLGEFRASTLQARDNLLQYRQRQLELEYRNNMDWIAANPKQQDGNAAMTIIGGVMSIAGAVLSVVPGFQPVGVGLAAGGAMLGQAGAPSEGHGLDLTNAAMTGATSGAGGSWPWSRGTTTSTGGANPYDKGFNSSGGLTVSSATTGLPWRR